MITVSFDNRSNSMRTEKFTVNNNDMEKLYYWNHYQSYLFQLMNDKTYNKQHHHALVWMVRYLGNTLQ